MALSVFTDTYSITPVRDPAWFEVQCNGYRITAAVPAVCTITLIQQPNNEDTFELTFGNATATFTFVTDPVDDSGNQVLIGANVVATLANLYTALQANWAVDQHFTVAEGETEHTLTARVPGLLTVGLLNTSPPTLAINQTEAGVDAVYAANYSAIHQIWVETGRNTNIYTPLPARDGRPGPDRRTKWNLQGMLHRVLEPLQDTWPGYGQSAISYLHHLMRRYYIARHEQYGTPPTPRIVQRGLVRTAWYAGSRNSEHRTVQQVFALIRSTQIPTPFLTYRGRAGRHEVSPRQQNYLGWYRNVPKVADQQLQVLATVFYTDDTSQTATLHTDANGSDWQQGDVILLPTGFEVAELHLLQPTKTPTHYTIVVHSHTAEPLSETYTYHLRLPDANELHLEWQNSLGAVESTRCVGQWVRGIRAEYDQVERLVAASGGLQPSPQDSERLHHLRGIDNTMDISTGFMDKAELDAVLDMLYSRRIYLLDHEREQREPVIPLPGEYIVGQQGTADENLYAFNFKCLITHSEMARSLRTAMPPVPEGEADWEGDDDAEDE